MSVPRIWLIPTKRAKYLFSSRLRLSNSGEGTFASRVFDALLKDHFGAVELVERVEELLLLLPVAEALLLHQSELVGELRVLGGELGEHPPGQPLDPRRDRLERLQEDVLDLRLQVGEAALEGPERVREHRVVHGFALLAQLGLLVEQRVVDLRGRGFGDGSDLPLELEGGFAERLESVGEEVALGGGVGKVLVDLFGELARLAEHLLLFLGVELDHYRFKGATGLRRL